MENTLKETITTDTNEKVYPSLSEIRSHLSDTCFESNVILSLVYVLFDITIVVGLTLLQYYIEKNMAMYSLYMYPFYVFLQGTFMWSIFVLGHDCGHESFSKYSLLNDSIGTLLHTFILVPYYPWKLSHRSHHQNTGSIEKDEIFHPIRETDYEYMSWSAKIMFETLYFLLGGGWFFYVIVGYSDRNIFEKDENGKEIRTVERPGLKSSHLSLSNPLFASHQVGVSLSYAALAIWSTCLIYIAYQTSFMTLVRYYFLPLFVFATWLVVVTFLHHHDVSVSLPWYGNKTWTYVKGNLSSVDRSYGVLHWLTHNIGTHQIHHLFPKIPHYNLIEATSQFGKKYPELQRVSEEDLISAFKENFNVLSEQMVIADDVQVHHYRRTKKE